MSSVARLGAALIAVSGCSAVQSSYVKAGYDATAPDATKRIAIVAFATPEHPGADTLFRSVVTDRVNLKMNYLVYYEGIIDSDWRDACVISASGDAVDATAEASDDEPGEPAALVEAPHPAPQGRELEGVLSIRAIEISVTHADDVNLHLIGELHRCSDNELLWRADGREGNAAEDEDLTALTESYVENLGPEIAPYAAPAFLVLRDMLDTLPDPVLNDDEVIEKIELGRIPIEPRTTATVFVALSDRLR